MSIISCLSSWDIYLSLGISLFSSFVTVSKFIKNFVILSSILLPIESPVASAVLWITLPEEVLSAFVPDLLP